VANSLRFIQEIWTQHPEPLQWSGSFRELFNKPSPSYSSVNSQYKLGTFTVTGVQAMEIGYTLGDDSVSDGTVLNPDLWKTLSCITSDWKSSSVFSDFATTDITYDYYSILGEKEFVAKADNSAYARFSFLVPKLNNAGA